MALKRRPPFNPKSFLAMVGEGRRIGEYRKDEILTGRPRGCGLLHRERQGEGHRRFGARQGSRRRNARNERFLR